MKRLKQLEADSALFQKGQQLHNCLMDLVGMCHVCESYQDFADEIWMELEEERAQLPGFDQALSKERLGWACKDLAEPLIEIPINNRIVSLALLLCK